MTKWDLVSIHYYVHDYLTQPFYTKLEHTELLHNSNNYNGQFCRQNYDYNSTHIYTFFLNIKQSCEYLIEFFIFSPNYREYSLHLNFQRKLTTFENTMNFL
jgi:hypothetical protein